MTLTLMHGDCLELMRDLSDNSVDLILCDLPYGVLTQQKGATPFGRNVKGPSNSGCSWDVKIDLAQFWEQARRILRTDHSPVIHFCTTKFGAELISSNPDWFRYDLVWDKQHGVSFLLANKMPMRSHEMIYVFSKKGAYYNRVNITGDFAKWDAKGVIKSNTYFSPTGTVKDGKHIIIRSPTGGDGTRCVKSVVQITGSKGKGHHPTEKPSELYRWLIERYCPEGGTVLDPTCGSGNSVFTAFDMDRHGIGMEMDLTFFQKLVARSNAMDVIEHVD